MKTIFWRFLSQHLVFFSRFILWILSSFCFGSQSRSSSIDRSINHRALCELSCSDLNIANEIQSVGLTLIPINEETTIYNSPMRCVLCFQMKTAKCLYKQLRIAQCPSKSTVSYDTRTVCIQTKMQCVDLKSWHTMRLFIFHFSLPFVSFSIHVNMRFINATARNLRFYFAHVSLLWPIYACSYIYFDLLFFSLSNGICFFLF